MAEQREQRVHRNPRMSLNALAQYMTASATSRESILRQQKYPPTFQVIWYRDAMRVITRYLLDPERDEDILVTGENRLRAFTSTDKNERQKFNDNVVAIASFRRCCGAITFDSLVAQRGPQSSHLMLEGVTISVRPEVLLTGRYRGNDCIGGIKIYLAKNDRLSEDAASTIAAILYRHLRRSAQNSEQPSLRHCMVVDAFGHSCTSAPRAVTRRQREIEANCREISLRWPSI